MDSNRRTSLTVPPPILLSKSDGFSSSSSKPNRNETRFGRSASTPPSIEHPSSESSSTSLCVDEAPKVSAVGVPNGYDLSMYSISPRIDFLALSAETSSPDVIITNLDNFKRELQINSQCQDQCIVQIVDIEKKLDCALELSSRGQLDDARTIYSEIIDSCEKDGITDLKEPILREAVWGLQINCSKSRSNDIMLAASSRPGRVAAQHQLGLIYSEGENQDELVACDLLQNAASKNYSPAISSLVSLANRGSKQAEKCLLKLIEKPELASQIIEMQLNIDIADEYVRKQLQQAVADGRNGNKHALELLREYEQKGKKFAVYFFVG